MKLKLKSICINSVMEKMFCVYEQKFYVLISLDSAEGRVNWLWGQRPRTPDLIHNKCQTFFYKASRQAVDSPSLLLCGYQEG